MGILEEVKKPGRNFGFPKPDYEVSLAEVIERNLPQESMTGKSEYIRNFVNSANSEFERATRKHLDGGVAPLPADAEVCACLSFDGTVRWGVNLSPCLVARAVCNPYLPRRKDS